MSITERKIAAVSIMFFLCLLVAGLLAGLELAKYVVTLVMVTSTGVCGYYVFGWAFEELFGNGVDKEDEEV